jgi:putative FmdB family regulatory protein
MPIYAYKCATCGHAKDVLQKMSDPPLTVCPACGAETFSKQVTAAGFQLKGSGWYVTDFKGGAGTAATPAVGGQTGDAKPADTPPAENKPADSKPSESKPAGTPSPAKADPAPKASSGGKP